MYELTKKIGKVFTSKFVGTGPSSYEKRIYRAAVSQSLRNTVINDSHETTPKRNILPFLRPLPRHEPGNSVRTIQ